jgi:hypothetical protein
LLGSGRTSELYRNGGPVPIILFKPLVSLARIRKYLQDSVEQLDTLLCSGLLNLLADLLGDEIEHHVLGIGSELAWGGSAKL